MPWNFRQLHLHFWSEPFPSGKTSALNGQLREANLQKIWNDCTCNHLATTNTYHTHICDHFWLSPSPPTSQPAKHVFYFDMGSNMISKEAVWSKSLPPCSSGPSFWKASINLRPVSWEMVAPALRISFLKQVLHIAPRSNGQNVLHQQASEASRTNKAVENCFTMQHSFVRCTACS